MALRHALLAAAAVVVLGASLYLFIAVRSSPGEAAVSPHERVTEARRDPGEVHLAAGTAQAGSDEEPTVREVHHGLVPHMHRATPDQRPGVADGSAAPDDPPADPSKPNPKLDALMGEANKAYDRGELDEAKQIAQRVLAQAPNNVRMLRILVSASCVDGDAAAAEASYAKLPPGDKGQMRVRCERYGVTFKDAPAPAVPAP